MLEESIRSGVTSRAISIHPEVVRVGSILLALALAGCSAQPIELAVSIRTDLAPGTDFTAARVELVPFQSGVTFDPQEADARSGDHYQQGVLVANFVGIPAGTNRVRAVLLDAAGQEVVARQVELALDESYALTIVLSANCRERSCPGTSEPATYTECLSGRCVEARCGGPDPRGCGDLACTTQADCQLGCLAACIEGACVCVSAEPPDAGPLPDVGPCPGECVPGETDEETLPCGCAGDGVQTRSRTCRDDCRWGPFGEPSACSTAGECTAGETESRSVSCGNCGTKTQTRTCTDSCTWGAWNDSSNCSGEGVCAPGRTQSRTVGCGNCGQQAQTRTCTDSCSWGSWTNSGSCGGQGTCSPGATRTGCDPCGHQVCSSSCSWGACEPKTADGCLRIRPGTTGPEGNNFRCCGTDRWQFCLPSCRWSTECQSCGGCSNC